MEPQTAFPDFSLKKNTNRGVTGLFPAVFIEDRPCVLLPEETSTFFIVEIFADP